MAENYRVPEPHYNHNHNHRVELRTSKPPPRMPPDNQLMWRVPLSTNAWLEPEDAPEDLTREGLTQWTSTDTVVSIYMLVQKTMAFDVYLRMRRTWKGPEECSITIRCLDISRQIVNSYCMTYEMVPALALRVFGRGYVCIELQGLKCEGQDFGEIADLWVNRPEGYHPEDLVFCPEPSKDPFEILQAESFRQGPVIGLTFAVPDDRQIEYLYNEVTVPIGFDVPGTAFTAIEFGYGMIVLQCQFSVQRGVMFAVCHSDNEERRSPTDFPVNLVYKNEGVRHRVRNTVTGGGECTLDYEWDAGVTYKFLVRIRPDQTQKDCTNFRAWFGKKGSPKWNYISEYRMSQKVMYAETFRCCVESIPNKMGHLERKAYFGNQWVYSERNRWMELTKATMSLRRPCTRLDFQAKLGSFLGGEDLFELRTCGFFLGNGKQNVVLERKQNDVPPMVDFELMNVQTFDVMVKHIAYTTAVKKVGQSIDVPVVTNGWIINDSTNTARLETSGLVDWRNAAASLDVYVYFEKSTDANLFLCCLVKEKDSRKLRVEMHGVTVDVECTPTGGTYEYFFVGRFQFTGTGYVKINISGYDEPRPPTAEESPRDSKKKKGKGKLEQTLQKTHFVTFPVVTHVSFTKVKTDLKKLLKFVPFTDVARDFRGKKGPTLMLTYEIPRPFMHDMMYYNDIAIPAGFDVPGTEIVVVGFDYGNLGVRFDSDGSHKVFFRLSSPQQGNDPKKILEENRLLSVGFDENCKIGSFRHETSMGRVAEFPFKIHHNRVYGFSVIAKPDPHRPNHVLFKAMVIPDRGSDVNVIAQFSRPKTTGLMTRFYSTLDNNLTETANRTREVQFMNQWATKEDMTLESLRKAKLTSVTFIAELERMDYDTNVQTYENEEGFCVSICGFFNKSTILNTEFQHEALHSQPLFNPIDI